MDLVLNNPQRLICHETKKKKKKNKTYQIHNGLLIQNEFVGLPESFSYIFHKDST